MNPRHKGPPLLVTRKSNIQIPQQNDEFFCLPECQLAGILAPDPDRFSGPKRGFSRILEKQ
jgi:hypothetical protein